MSIEFEQLVKRDVVGKATLEEHDNLRRPASLDLWEETLVSLRASLGQHLIFLREEHRILSDPSQKDAVYYRLRNTQRLFGGIDSRLAEVHRLRREIGIEAERDKLQRQVQDLDRQVRDLVTRNNNLRKSYEYVSSISRAGKRMADGCIKLQQSIRANPTITPAQISRQLSGLLKVYQAAQHPISAPVNVCTTGTEREV